jgi:hypothetical protein
LTMPSEYVLAICIKGLLITFKLEGKTNVKFQKPLVRTDRRPNRHVLKSFPILRTSLQRYRTLLPTVASSSCGNPGKVRATPLSKACVPPPVTS